MPTNKDDSPTSQHEPVAEQFSKFEKNYGGDAVNAHDDRMDSILDENAKQLDQEVSNERSGTTKRT